jgi:hypothetical protein
MNKLPNDVQQIIGLYIHKSLYWNVLVELHIVSKMIGLKFAIDNDAPNQGNNAKRCPKCKKWHGAHGDLCIACDGVFMKMDFTQCRFCYKIHICDERDSDSQRITFLKAICISCVLNQNPQK